MGAKNAPLADRLWRRVNKSAPDGCWVWCGCVTNRGYGQIKHNGTALYTHRVAYELLVGPIESGTELDHICHNPSCVNPSHLRACSHADNLKNASLPSHNTSGFKGVSWSKYTKRWHAYINASGKRTHLGYFSTPNSAHIAYRNAARTLHGEFANFGEADHAPKT